jgi:cell division septal protein FtsQ
VAKALLMATLRRRSATRRRPRRGKRGGEGPLFAARRRRKKRGRGKRALLGGHAPQATTVRRIVLGAVVVIAVGASLLWLRDSAFFSVEKVEVTGLTGPAKPRIVATLRDTAAGMSTMHVDEGKLRKAVGHFPQVKRIEISRKGTHELRIKVIEWIPVGAVTAGGRRIPVAADGTLLEGLTTDRELATVPIDKTPTGRRLRDDRGLEGVELLASAPPPLRGRVARVSVGARGLSVTLREGPDLYFGTPERLAAKWLAAASVLADADARGARYIDLTVPEHPAAGGVQQTAQPGEEGLTEDDPATEGTDESGLAVDQTDDTEPVSEDTEAPVEG